ncbi:hypothetical protein [Caulobacter sp. UC70_42]|uniref:hypothetical protein n=1 Tax=Caulobacter sp. UC70_42 TaxID=3374551 RepID=UPI0037578E91
MTDERTTQLEDVLDAFAVEETDAKATLDRYLTAYPQFAGDLIDLSRELLRADQPVDTELSPADVAKIDAAWIKHAAALPHHATDPFAALSPTRSREIALELAVPRQILTSFRERRIQPATVPEAFLRRLAAALAVSVDDFLAWMIPPPANSLARSYRADGQPGAATQLAFERVLIDAGVSESDRARLLADEN